MDKLVDRFNREINYLRISVTDRCNLRCVYCMPVSGIIHKHESQILSFEEIYRIVDVAVSLGIQKVRITGGEPLVRKNLPFLIEKLRSLKELKEIALTTNGIYLSDYARSLRMAGLDRLNISLDTLIPKKFFKITRGGDIELVFKGLESAFLAGLSSLKINTVLMKGFNEDEILDFVRLAKEKPLHIRFIEYMPTNLSCSFQENIFFSALKAKDICKSLGELIPVDNEQTATARTFRIEGFCGTIGFISPISEPFCSSCNKLRLTADGRLRGCLHSSKSVDLKEAIDRGAQEEELVTLIRKAVALKERAHNLGDEPIGIESENFSMCQIGG